MAEPSRKQAKEPVGKSQVTGGFSALLARIFDQLSLSAWLPATMLVGSLAVLIQLHSRRDRDLAKAVDELTKKPLGTLVLLLFALLLANVVTQAFEFEVIRLLEGYWGAGLLASGLARLFTFRQRRSLDRLLGRRDKLELRAFRRARLLETETLPSEKSYLVELIAENLGGPEIAHTRGWRARRRRREAAAYNWQRWAPAASLRRLRAVEYRISEFPADHRLMPTKLGNVLRAAEDAIKLRDDEDLESFVLRRMADIPAGLRQEHDQYRTRLDMYCTLVFVFAVLAIAGPVLVTHGRSYLVATIATSGAYVTMAAVSYAAAVSSARGYRTALLAIAARGSRQLPWRIFDRVRAT